VRTFLFEGVQDIGIPLNWGKFMVGVPDLEWSARSEIDPGTPYPLLQQIGWTPEHIWVFDLQTGEAAIFNPNGMARADLEKHRIWVCPLFEMFLTWLYRQNINALHLLPRIVQLPDAQFSINGYRRLGPHDVSFTLRKGDVLMIEWAGEPRPVLCEDITDEGVMIRSLTDAEIEEYLPQDEPVETVKFTFPGGSTVTVGPDGGVLESTEPTAALEAPEALDLAATAGMLIAADEPTAAIDVPGEEETAVLPAADTEETETLPAAEDEGQADVKKTKK
jgi:hypothetical protein